MMARTIFFRSEVESTRFLHMRTNRSNTGEMYSDKTVIHLLSESEVAGANGEVRFCTGSCY